MRSKMEMEVETATSIVESMRNTIEEIEKRWPASKRGSNGAHALQRLKDQRDTAALCLKDAVSG